MLGSLILKIPVVVAAAAVIASSCLARKESTMTRAQVVPMAAPSCTM